MSAHRTAALVGVAPLLLTAWAAGPAAAHGAPTNPVSRVVACSPGGQQAESAACKAAVASGVAAFDNLRLANVGGRDRQVVPDGELCSGGLDDYRGLDLARSDWPATRLSAGADLTVTYRSTIPHTGSFKLFMTKNGYDPTKPLKWSDLPSKPFATVTDPSLENGSYHIEAKLPSDLTGRHLLYTIWQNTSTSDTYYSCSDVVFAGGKDEAAAEDAEDKAGVDPATDESKDSDASTESDASVKSPAEGAGAPTKSTTSVTGTPGEAVAAGGSDDSSTALPLVAGGAAGLLITAGAAFTLRRRR